jgi:hypothetical protein
MLAYDLAPLVEAEAVCHGLTRDGEFVVACVRDDEAPVTTWDGTPLRVRLELVKEAPEYSVRITAYAVHLLGVLDWLEDDVRERYVEGAGLPPRLAELASGPAGRLGIVRTDRVLLHDSSGVTPLGFEDLVGHTTSRSCGFPGVDAEWAARELVGRLSPDEVGTMLNAAASGWGAALPISERKAGGCPHLGNQIFCVDVDSVGLTLMEVESGLTSVTILLFDEPASSAEELGDRLERLIESSSAFSAARR